MQEDDPSPDPDGGAGDESDAVTVLLTEDGFEVGFTTPEGAVRTLVFPYPEGAYPCANKGGADRARARTEAGVIEIRVKCKNGEEEIYSFRYEGTAG
jgi:hypothetical protein